MIRIIRFLIEFCESLFTEWGFKFVDSSVHVGRDDVASVLLESGDAQFYFSLERAELLLEVRSKYDSRKRNWYSFDLLRQLLTGESEASGVLDEANAVFLRENLSKIVSLFEKEEVNNTMAQLDVLQKERTRSL